MRNLYRLAVYAGIGFCTWWSHRERARVVETLPRAPKDFERELCASPW